jgi:hypothetical protein
MRKGKFGSGSSDSAYLYIAWASDAVGTGFTMVFNPALKYIAVKSTTEPISVPVIGDFAGLWRKYVGENGEPGYTPQKGTDYFDGDDGYTPYIQGGYWYVNGVNTGIVAAGVNGRGITSIALISTVGLVKTYRITLTDTSYYDFSVVDGNDGNPGADGGTTFDVHFIFDAAGALTYSCPYALKFTAMINQQANAPTLSTALNVNMTQYQILTVTADAAGLVTLTGTWL